MDRQQTGIKFEKPQILKKALQFLISLCVFYFLFSYSSMISFLDLSFNLYFSMFFVQLLDYTNDRKYMFLLCNGILAFLAMSSGVFSSSTVETTDIYDEFHRRNRDHVRREFELSEKKAAASEDEVVTGSSKNSESALVMLGTSKNSESALVVGGSRDHRQRAFELSEKKAGAKEDEVVLVSSKNSESALIVLESSKNSESALVVLGSSKNSESALVVLGSSKNSESALAVEGRGGNGCLNRVEDENGYLIAVGKESSFIPASAVAAEGEEEESTEELNKKCEDFIRMFKHRIRTEAQRQLVVV